MVNQLQQAPHGYHPTAPEAFDGWTNPGAWAFVEAFPSAADLVRAGKRKWDKFPHGHKLFRAQTYPERIAAFQRADQWQAGAPIVAAKSLLAVARRRQLRVLQGQIEACRQRGAALFASHPGSGMFGSLPAAGPKIAPRLLGGIGSDRALHQDPKGLQCMAGTAPVSYQSGKARNARIRRGRNKHLRHAMCLFAGKSRAQCAWAARYCETHRARGKSHARALRCLGQRRARIIWKMWQQSRTPYDPEMHFQNQLKPGSRALQINPG